MTIWQASCGLRRRDDTSRTPDERVVDTDRLTGGMVGLPIHGGCSVKSVSADEIRDECRRILATDTAAAARPVVCSDPDDKLATRTANGDLHWTRRRPSGLVIAPPGLTDRRAHRQINRRAGKLKNITDRSTVSR